jgi:hypothetical protein
MTSQPYGTADLPTASDIGRKHALSLQRNRERRDLPEDLHEIGAREPLAPFRNEQRVPDFEWPDRRRPNVFLPDAREQFARRSARFVRQKACDGYRGVDDECHQKRCPS